jgi:hypothetical protein
VNEWILVSDNGYTFDFEHSTDPNIVIRIVARSEEHARLKLERMTKK